VLRLRGAALAVALLALAAGLAACDPLDDRVAQLMSSLEYLSSRGIDVRNLTRSLDLAVKLYEANRTEEALAALANLSAQVQALVPLAEEVHLRATVARYLSAAAILSLPAVTYVAVPRVYLYVWYRLHRGWVVRRREGGGGR